MAAARRRRLRPTTIATSVIAVLVLLPSAAATPQSSGEDSAGELTITSITPVVEEDGTAQVRGRLTNTGTSTMDGSRVDLVPREAATKRSEIAEWTESGDPVDGPPADSTDLDAIPAGGSAPFALSVDAEDLAPGMRAGAPRVSVQTEETAVHTFLGVHRAKEYEPLEVVWGVPLLLPTNRRLFGAPSEERVAAWEETLGPDSRLARLSRTGPGSDEAWLLDPTLLELPPEPPEGTEEDRAAAMSSERDLRSERAAQLREQLVGNQTLVLPQADADVAAGAESETAGRIIAPRLQAGRTMAGRLGARANVIWPADGLVTDRRAAALQSLHPGPETATVLAPTSSFAPSGFTPTGAARTTDDTPVLVSDETISTLAGSLTSTEDVTLARQRLVAETSAVLSERPGTPRSLFVLPDRNATPSPEAYEALRATTSDIPWLTKGDLPSLFEQADEAEAEQVPRSPGQIRRSTTSGQVRPPVLSERRARAIAHDERAVSTFASVRPDGTTWRRTIDPSLDQLSSARWRSAPVAHVRLYQDLSDAATLNRNELEVSSGDVNFFADTGRLQITIVNNTDVELSNLSVDLTSENPSFRLDDEIDPVTIGPGGRQTVSVQATALAAGRAPVHVVVTTPEGEELTDPATLRVRLQPTGGAVYWVIGGIAAALLAAGTWRTVRRPQKQTVTEDEE